MRCLIDAQQAHKKLIEKIEKNNWQTREEVNKEQEMRRQLSKESKQRIDDIFSKLL